MCASLPPFNNTIHIWLVDSSYLKCLSSGTLNGCGSKALRTTDWQGFGVGWMRGLLSTLVMGKSWRFCGWDVGDKNPNSQVLKQGGVKLRH